MDHREKIINTRSTPFERPKVKINTRICSAHSRSERLRRRGYTPCAIVPKVNAIKIAAIAAATFASTDSFIFAPFWLFPLSSRPDLVKRRLVFT
jgi:hypothetical protein